MNNTLVNIKPELIRFVISNSGYTKNQIIQESNRKYTDSSRTKIFNEEFIDNLEQGKEQLDISLLKSLDEKLFKRGLPFYFLSFIPEEKISLNFRKNSEVLPPKDRIILRKYQALRYELKNLLKNNNLDFKKVLKDYTIKDNSKNVACEIRKQFDYDENELLKGDDRILFNEIRDKIEENNLFVFKTDMHQDKSLNLSGCVFSKSDLPTLILIKNENTKRNIFTLLHEFAHYLLNEGEDVILENESNSNDIEWGAILLHPILCFQKIMMTNSR